MKLVVIDAGHGGNDSGAVGNGLYEKDINLSVSKLVSKKLNDMNISTIMTRDSDLYVSLQGRTKISNSVNADLFISIHCNSASNKNAKGIETFYNKDKKFASLIQGELVKNITETNNRGIKFGNFHVIRESKSPSCLVELGFISNVEDSKMLKYRQELLANSIVDGIVKMLGVHELKKIKIKVNGKIREVDSINVKGNNFVKLQDIRDDKIKIEYDGMPVIRV